MTGMMCYRIEREIFGICSWYLELPCWTDEANA